MQKTHVIGFVVALILMNCQKEGPGIDQPTLASITKSKRFELDPTGYCPLAAMLFIEFEIETSIAMRLIGKNGSVSDLNHSFGGFEKIHELLILGLYPDHQNEVELIITPKGSRLPLRDTLLMSTQPLISDLPDVEIDLAKRNQMMPGMTFVDYYGHDGKANPQKAFAFDAFGEIRWYLDFKDHPELDNLFYDVGMKRLANGNLFFGDRWTNVIYETDMLGNVIDHWPMPGFRFHHEVIEKPNGNFLATVNKKGIATVEDHLIEIDRQSKQIITIWDLRESLDASRRTFTDDVRDWIHVNAILYDSSDDDIIITGRTQGVFKLSPDNELIWILNPHVNWRKSGNGTELSPFLMQPLDDLGSPINNEDLLLGTMSHPDFDWPWYAHAPHLMPNGNLMLFDNGENRNFGAVEVYSRAVEYEIDDEARTLKQIWTYGKERGKAGFSRIVSDVDYIQEYDRIMYTLGAIAGNPLDYGIIVELDYRTKERIFEATITPPKSVFDITMHRSERMSLYSQ